MHGGLGSNVAWLAPNAMSTAAPVDEQEHPLDQGDQGLVAVSRPILGEDQHGQAGRVAAHHKPLVLRISLTCCTSVW